MLGFLIERGYFCMYSGFTNMVIAKNYRIMKVVVWTFLLTMLTFHALSSFGIITLKPKELFWAGNIIGAVAFGVGMVLSGSCIVGTPLRAASGRIAYWFTLLGMGVGGWIVSASALKDFFKKHLMQGTEIKVAGSVPTWSNVLGINSWIIVVLLAVISGGLLYYLYKKDTAVPAEEENATLMQKIFRNLWAPVAISFGFVVLEVLAFLTKKSPAGLGGFIKGYATYIQAPFTGKWGLNEWALPEVTGILVGVFISSLISKEFRIIGPSSVMQVVRLTLGGLLMGMGATIAVGGCNVAHIFSHMPQLSVGSFISGLIIVLTTVSLIHLFVKEKGV